MWCHMITARILDNPIKYVKNRDQIAINIALVRFFLYNT